MEPRLTEGDQPREPNHGTARRAPSTYGSVFAGRRLQPYTEVDKALAHAQARRSFGDKTDGRLPTTFFGMPPGLVSAPLGVQHRAVDQLHRLRRFGR
jgi:hypothetical protein